MYYEKDKSQIYFNKNQLEFVSLDQLVPLDHILRLIENAIDFDFIYKLTKEYYSDFGRPCLDTIVLFKIAFLNFIEGKNSIRKTLEEAKVNMAYRWFLNLGLNDKIPNYSTFSQNYIRRYKDTDVFEKIFTVIITKLIELNLIDTSTVFVDGTHIKANANKHKSIKKAVKVVADKYHQELNSEIDEFREYNGRDKYNDEDDNPDNYTINEDTGEIEKKDDNQVREITVSSVDPDSGMFVKGEHERSFAYVDQVACDKNGWILGFDVNPANMHDSKAFLPFFENQLLKYNPKIICADAGYANALITKNVQYKGIKFLVPYVRPRGRETEFSKKLFSYQMEIDAYLCPNKKILEPTNINRDGYIEYTITKKECGSCKFSRECLKNYTKKTIRRHIYEDCVELAKEYRLSDEGKKIYKLRKQTIERKFAEGKERHGLRYTRYIGLQKNRDLRSLLYACMNLKKLALLLNRRANKQINMQYS
ncbi:MAG: IS1182 family transposase [Bacilli bacterium]